MYGTAKINKRIFPLLSVAALIMIFAVRCALTSGTNEPKVDNASDIVSFLSEYGWTVEPEPVSVKEVQIPANFSEVYEQYNDLQKKQGFDLSKYRADLVQSYNFRVLNHPAGGEVFANVMVFNNKIIGGDICSYALNGFMTGFSG